MERLDSLSTKKPALKFKPKVVARKALQDRTALVKTPTVAPTNTKKQPQQRKPKARPNNDVVVSAGPLAQGAISLGGGQTYSRSSGGFVGGIKREPGLEIDEDGLVDVNNPTITDSLFPHKPSREESPDTIEENVQLKEDYETIKKFLVESRDQEGDVKMEEQDDQFTFLQLPKLPLEAKEGEIGLVGRVNVHESGKLTLQIGEVVFDLSVGGQTNAQEVLWGLKTSDHECFKIGDVQKRIVGTPSF